MDLGGELEGLEEEEIDTEDLLHPNILPRGSTEEGVWRSWGLSNLNSTSEVKDTSPTSPGQDSCVGKVEQGRILSVFALGSAPEPRQ